jgi:hypothetical protein
MWGLADGPGLDKKIVSFVKELTNKAGESRVEDRWFSIQFISFATDPLAQEHLEYLDSGLHEDNAPMPDVIDTKPWHHPEVHNLILGSLDKYADLTPGGDPQSPTPTIGSGYTPAGPSRAPTHQSLSPNPQGLRRSASSQSKRKSGLSFGSLLKKP